MSVPTPGRSGLGSNFQSLGDGRHWIDGVEVDEAEYLRRIEAAMALSAARAAEFDRERNAAAEESNAIAAWLTAEQEWIDAHPDPDAPVRVRPSELRAMIAAEVTAALAATTRPVAGTPDGQTGTAGTDILPERCSL